MEIEISGYKVLIDDEDWEKVRQYKWIIDKKRLERKGDYRIQTNHHFPDGSHKTIILSRLIMGIHLSGGPFVDHISGNTLDNRKSNLRLCSNMENCWNSKVPKNSTTGYKSVCRENNKYRSYFTYKKRRYNLGYYSTPEEAGRAYDKAALYYYKEYARTNFPKETYTQEDLEWAHNYVENLICKRCNKSSKYRGVTRHKCSWQAYITKDRKRETLGSYKTEDEAAKAYDKRAIELFGDTASLNFPKENYINEGAKE